MSKLDILGCKSDAGASAKDYIFSWNSDTSPLIIPPLHRRWNWGILDSPRCLSVRLSVRPSVDKVSRTFWKKTIGSIHFIPGIYPYYYMGWVSWPLYIFVFLASFSALWWPNIWPKMGFPEPFEKTIGSIHFIPGFYPYGVSFLIPVHFRVPSLILGPLVAKYLAENGVSGTFRKNYWLNSFHTWQLSLWGESLDPYTFSCS